MSAVPMSGVHRLLIAAAGTGGHVMPGLAIAQALRAKGWVVTWLGTRTGMERSLVERAGLEFHAIAFGNFRGKGIMAFAQGALRLAQAFVASVRIVRRAAPHVVLTTGGYVAVPAGLAAAWLHRPVSFLNADAAPQLSLRILLHFVRVVLCGFNGAAAHLAGSKARVSGAPVRAEVAALPEPSVRMAGRTGPLALLVVGGSLGAKVLNEVVPQALSLMAPSERPITVHQCGAGHEQATRRAYESRGLAVELLPFIEDIAARYAAADVVLCRAGAITVTELCVAGLGAILVPLVAATTAHQRANAEFLAAHGAAVHLPQDQCTAQRLAQVLRGLTRPQLQQMAQSARALGRPDATAYAVREIESLVRPAEPAA
ncbi:MAG TPA: undecaprenyldiphospho-muramoylpentapeptide beta-N-acetylglucosaminyltransferase [Burkholderiaceae bacterium]|nr:undecaprenyldiphospho-muramoylpentapeptide beta-N-acetylglucosaminyltransferase [Burkholderiaceae bacterium]